MVTDYFFVYSYFFQCEEKNWEKYLGYGNNRKQTEKVPNLLNCGGLNKVTTALFYQLKKYDVPFYFWCYKPAKYGLICVVKMSENGWRHLAHKWSFKVLSLLEACFDLISGSSLSMKIQIMGGKITDYLGFKSLLRKVKMFCSFFFSFSNSSHKRGYLLFLPRSNVV